MIPGPEPLHATLPLLLMNPKTALNAPLFCCPSCVIRLLQVFNPFQYILPRGQLFTFTSRDGWIVDYRTNTWLQPVPRLRGYADTQWPYSATGAMLALLPENNYQVGHLRLVSCRPTCKWYSILFGFHAGSAAQIKYQVGCLSSADPWVVAAAYGTRLFLFCVAGGPRLARLMPCRGLHQCCRAVRTMGLHCLTRITACTCK